MNNERAEEFEKWASDVIFGRAKGFRAMLMRVVLRMFSWLFRILVSVRLRLFRRGWKRQTQMGTLVIRISILLDIPCRAG